MLSTTHPALWIEMHEQRVNRAPHRVLAEVPPTSQNGRVKRNRLRSPVTRQLAGAEQR